MSPNQSDNEQPPTETPTKEGHSVPSSIVLVTTGNGKGKSTAAFGTVLRAVAVGWPVSVVQFLKSGEWQVGEEKMCRQLGVEWLAAGDGFTWDSSDLDESRAQAVAAWEVAAERIASGNHRLVVMDEISYPIAWGWIEVGDVVAAIENRPSNVSLFFTGRDMASEVIDAADTVTEMLSIRHAFDSGKLAKKGIDH